MSFSLKYSANVLVNALPVHWLLNLLEYSQSTCFCAQVANVVLPAVENVLAAVVVAVALAAVIVVEVVEQPKLEFLADIAAVE